MTTIAYDGKTLAADTRYAFKNSFYGYAHKITPLLKGGVIATSGTVGGAHLIAQALNKNIEPLKVMSKKQLDAIDSIHIDADGNAFCLDGTAYVFLPIEEHTYACGSGEQTAMAFMRAGFTAAQAVKATSKVDLSTNDLVDVYDIKRKAFKLADFPR